MIRVWSSSCTGALRWSGGRAPTVASRRDRVVGSAYRFGYVGQSVAATDDGRRWAGARWPGYAEQGGDDVIRSRPLLVAPAIAFLVAACGGGTAAQQAALQAQGVQGPATGAQSGQGTSPEQPGSGSAPQSVTGGGSQSVSGSGSNPAPAAG